MLHTTLDTLWTEITCHSHFYSGTKVSFYFAKGNDVQIIKSPAQGYITLDRT